MWRTSYHARLKWPQEGTVQLCRTLRVPGVVVLPLHVSSSSTRASVKHVYAIVVEYWRPAQKTLLSRNLPFQTRLKPHQIWDPRPAADAANSSTRRRSTPTWSTAPYTTPASTTSTLSSPGGDSRSPTFWTSILIGSTSTSGTWIILKLVSQILFHVSFIIYTYVF